MTAISRLLTLAALAAARMRTAARRLYANRRLVAGLMLGFAVAVAAAAGIPVFAATALQRVLQQELNAEAGQKLLPAAVHIAHFENAQRPTTLKQYLAADAVAREQGAGLLGLPVKPFVRYGSTEQGKAVPAKGELVNPDVTRWMSLAFQSDLAQHITLTDGRLPNIIPSGDGPLETIVEEAALDKQDFTVGTTFSLPLGRSPSAPAVPVKVVGAFKRTDPMDPYWFQGNPYEQQFFVPEEMFTTVLRSAPGAHAGQYSWYWGIQTADVKMTNAIPLLTGMYDLESRLAQAIPDTEIFDGPQDLLTRYVYRAASLRLMLLLLAVPPLAAVTYFIVVTSGLIIEGQRQEIAVLRSRGAGLWQVLSIYVMEGLLMAGLALGAGLPVGVLLSRLMASAVGFLDFVDRKLPGLLLPPEFWLYGLTAAALAVLAYVLPVLPAARHSIVTYKSESARSMRRPLWTRFGLDLLCLGLAGYGYYTLLGQQARTGGGATFTEPLHLLAPALFVMGAGLLLLRVVPLLVKLAGRLTARRAPAPLYLAMVQLGRAPAAYTPVILLLTMTVGMGLYSASAARTLERNISDRVLYAGGADVVLDESWDFAPALNAAGQPSGGGTYSPPPWEGHYDLPGVAHPARVRVQGVTSAVAGKSQRQGALMAIDPYDFSQVAWFRRDLSPAHMNAYLNLLAADEEAVLVTPEFLSRTKTKPGDRITLEGTEGQQVSLVIYGAIDYWPTLYPQEGEFFIANLDFIESNLGLQPYKVWLKLKPGATVQPIIDALRAQSVSVIQAVDTRQKLINARRDPQVSGMLGGLTNGFLVAAAITLLGFWLHAALSAKGRLLQFGVLRAMGLTRRQLTVAVVAEQVLTAAVGVLTGTGIGWAAARLFVPFLQQGARPADQTPPFLVVSTAWDRTRLYLVLLVMLAASVAGLMLYLTRLRIHEAVKLGEDH